MTPDQIEALGPAFADSLRQFLFCCAYTPTFDLLGVYCRGLLSNLPRKTAEPIALAAGTAVRTLQEFVRDHAWSYRQTRTTLQASVATLLPTLPADDLGTVGLVDETGTVKQGTKTPGVHRQYCGERGKLENGIVTVHRGVTRGRYQTLLDASWFLPPVWDRERDRCRAAISDDVRYQPKWQLALRQVVRAAANGIDLDWLTCDEGYGSKPGFLRGLDERGQLDVGEVPKSFRAYTARPRLREASPRADDLVRHSPAFHQQPAQVCHLARQTLGAHVWEVKAARVWLPWEARCGTRQHWLLWARNVRTGAAKYCVSNAPAAASLERLLRVAFRRWHVAHGFRLRKTEIGFRHFEGQSYVGLLRHVTLCLVTLTFVAGPAEGLRGEKAGGDSGAGVPGAELRVRGVAGGVAGDDGVAIHVGSHLLPSAA